MKLPKVLPSSVPPSNLTEKAQWLSGEGAGSWFEILSVHDAYKISRYCPIGKLECSDLFKASDLFEPTKNWKITYPSHCGSITIIQGGKEISFTLYNR